MVKLVTMLKRRRDAQAPSLRTLRRAVRPARTSVGKRVVIFLILLSLIVGAIAISVNLVLERWEKEHSTGLHGM